MSTVEQRFGLEEKAKTASNPTVTVPRAWIERLVELADEVKERDILVRILTEMKTSSVSTLIGYIESARSLIGDAKENE